MVRLLPATVALPACGMSALSDQPAPSDGGSAPIDVVTPNGDASALSHLVTVCPLSVTLTLLMAVHPLPVIWLLPMAVHPFLAIGISSSGVATLSHRSGVPALTVSFCNLPSHYLIVTDTHLVTFRT